MIAFLKGKVDALFPTSVWLDVAGVGYELHISQRTHQVLKSDEMVLLYTYLQVREDAHTLYGFFTEAEQQSFKLLIQISGISGSLARVILSALSSEELVRVVYAQDVQRLKQIKGIGVKTAERLLLELKSKINQFAEQIRVSTQADKETPSENIVQDVVRALQALGISKQHAEATVAKLRPQIEEGDTLEQLITKALQSV